MTDYRFIKLMFFCLLLLPLIKIFAASIHQNTTSTQISEKEADNLWQEIVVHFQLKRPINQVALNTALNWYLAHPAIIANMEKQSEPYLYYIYHETQKRHFPAELALLPMVESNYDPFAYSWVGAAGLWQFMPKTGRDFKLNNDWWCDKRKSIPASTTAALDYFFYLQHFFKDWLLSIAAYNAGSIRVESEIEFNTAQEKPTDFWDLNLPLETQYYVPKLLAIAEILANPKKYGMPLPYLPNRPYFKIMTIENQVDLKQLAENTHTPLNTLYVLNPQFKQFATCPSANNQVLLPILK